MDDETLDEYDFNLNNMSLESKKNKKSFGPFSTRDRKFSVSKESAVENLRNLRVDAGEIGKSTSARTKKTNNGPQVIDDFSDMASSFRLKVHLD